MPEGTSAFLGRGVGQRGNYVIQGDNDTDDTLTVKGASSSAAGDVFVVKNSTGTEFLVISASGFITQAPYGLSIAGASSFASTLRITGALTNTSTGNNPFSGQISVALSSTLQAGGFVAAISSTGALAAGAVLANGIAINNAATGVLNAAILYDSTGGTAVSLFGVNSSAASSHPGAFLVIGGSAGYSSGAGNVSGSVGAKFFTAASSYYLTSALATTMPLALLKVLAGSKVFYLPMLTDTMIAAA